MPRLREEQRINLSPEFRNRILRDTGYRCAHCNILLRNTHEDEFSVEHVVPLRKGGSNNPRNLIALCKSCNEAKQDDIIDPKEYYAYAPEWKLKEICETFDKYIRDVDWLAYDTLFKLDRFDLPAMKSFLNPKSHKIFNIPATYQVHRMRRQEVHDYLLEYTGHRDTLDKPQMNYELDEINTTYYCIMGNGETIMIVSPYIMNTDYGIEEGHERIAVFLDYFVNFNIKTKPPGTYGTIANIIHACAMKIRETVEMRTPRNREVVDLILRTPRSDDTALEGMRMFKRVFHPYADIFYSGQLDGYQNVNMILRFYNGTREDLVEEAKASGMRVREYHTDIRDRQDDVKARLEKSREIETGADKIKKITKKEKKARHKKPKRKK